MTYFLGTTSRQKIKFIWKKGVRNTNRNDREIIYYTKRKIGFGVRKDNVIHMRITSHKNELVYSRPCVCGSLTHRTTKHSNCFLNVRYMDVPELNN